jgi:hypothetical protein
MKPRRFESETIVSRSGTAGPTSSLTAVGGFEEVVTAPES